jgi:dihydrofolate synthase/folylpolyglutamate synthase
VNERIRVDGRPIDDVALADAISTVRGTAEHLGVTLSAFEAVTLAALLVFSDAPVDVAVIEVGLLGRFDATNVVEADVAVITNIGSDHTDFSPDWKAKIASEKAGIIDRRSHVVLGDIADELVDIIASEPHATLARYGRDFDCEENHLAVGGRRVATVQSSGSRIDATVPLHGRHQGENFAVAVEAAEAVLATQLSSEVVNEAMTTMPPLTGRVEMLAIDPVVIADGAHNPEAAAALGTTLAETFMVPGRRTALVSMLAGRDPQTFLTALHRAYPLDLVVACELADPRAAPAAEIAAAADAVGIACVQSPSIEAGMQRAFQQGDADDLIVVTGSFRVVAPARAASRQRNQ